MCKQFSPIWNVISSFAKINKSDKYVFYKLLVVYSNSFVRLNIVTKAKTGENQLRFVINVLSWYFVSLSHNLLIIYHLNLNLI